MANVKTTLTVEGNGTSNSFSNTKNYKEEKITKYVLDSGVEGGTEIYTMHSFSPSTKSANSSAAPKAFCVYNHGTTGAEIQFTTTAWAAAAPDTASGIDETSYMTFLLGAGEMMFSNQLRIINYSEINSAALGDTSALALASDKVSTAMTSTVGRGGAMGAATSGEDSATSTAIAIDDFAEKFRVGDYIYVDATTDDVFRVTATDGATDTPKF